VKESESYLTSESYSQNTIRHYRQVWNQLADYAYEHDYAVIEKEWVTAFLYEHYKIGKDELTRNQRTYRRAADALYDFQENGSISYCVKRNIINDELISEYLMFFDSMEKYCSQRNLSTQTRRYHYQQTIKLALFLDDNKIRASDINAEHLRKYFLTFSGYAPKTIRMHHYVLRNILHTAYENEYISTDLSLVCETPRTLAWGKIPSAYVMEDVQSLLSAVDRESPTGKRDYAILLLGARLGLRASDIRTMTFENIHWETHEIRIVQEKTKNELILPLSDEVGWAIIDYLKHGRPVADCKQIFIRHNAPFAPFGITNSLGAIISKYFRLANVCVPEGKKRGMHILRHSLASSMLAAKIPLPIVSEALDHSDIKTTMHYLKIDVDKLKGCALDIEDGGDCS
jgi:site-specific recombinase XerD